MKCFACLVTPLRQWLLALPPRRKTFRVAVPFCHECNGKHLQNVEHRDKRRLFRQRRCSVVDVLNRLNRAIRRAGKNRAKITAISLSIGLSQGFDSTGFFIAFVLSIVVIYDARGIRYTVGKHAKLLNQTILKDDKFELNEHIGHSLPEIIVGIVLGASITIYLYIALAI